MRTEVAYQKREYPVEQMGTAVQSAKKTFALTKGKCLVIKACEQNNSRPQSEY